MSALTLSILVSQEPTYLRAVPVAMVAGALAARIIQRLPFSPIQGMSIPMALLFQGVATCAAIVVSKYLRRRGWRGLPYQMAVPFIPFVAGLAALNRARLPIEPRALFVNAMVAHLFALLFVLNFKYRL